MSVCNVLRVLVLTSIAVLAVGSGRTGVVCAGDGDRPTRRARGETAGVATLRSPGQQKDRSQSHLPPRPPTDDRRGSEYSVTATDDGNTSLALTGLIRTALEQNPDLQSALERVRIADAALSGARAAFYPRLSVAEKYGVSDNPAQAFTFVLNQARLDFNRDFNDPQTTDDFHTQLQFQQSLYTGGRRTAEQRAAAAERNAAAYSLDTVRNELVFRIAEAYYRLLQARDLVGVRRETVEQVRTHLEIVRTRLRAGTAVKSDVLSVQVRLAEAQEALITAENRLELAWAVLDNTVGTRVARRPLPEGVPEAPWSDRIEDLQAAVEAALRQRPELNRLGSRRRAASARIRAAEAGNYPTLDFVSSYDVFTGDFAQGNDSFFVGLVARLNLFDGGRTRSRVEQAEARLRELGAEQRKLLQDVELDVRRAYLRLNDAESRLEVAERAVEFARESLREIEVRYRGQTATITELIDAQVDLSEARVRQTNARADVQTARTALQRAVGRLGTLVGR